MSKKKIVLDSENYPEYGYRAVDEDGVVLHVKSNAGSDKGLFLEHAKKLERPIAFTIEGEVFDAYRFKSFALNISEAKNLIREVSRMVDYLEESE